MTATCDIAVIGLEVMGRNLALNMESRGYTVAVYNRTGEKTDKFMEGPGKGKRFTACHTLEEVVAALKTPRKVMMMVKAGPAVDTLIDALLPHLSPGDVIIDGGNTHFADTERRTAYVESKGLLYIGTGVSGGEEGALKGPSMMPGGSEKAWPLVKRSPPRSARTTTFLVAIGSGRAVPDTTSRWSTTASSTATCSSFARPIGCSSMSSA